MQDIFIVMEEVFKAKGNFIVLYLILNDFKIRFLYYF